MDGMSTYVTYLARHRKFVMHSASTFTKLDRTSMKIGWLAQYHNSVVHALPDAYLAGYAAWRADLLVPEETVYFLPRV